MIREDEFRISRRPYAVDLASYRVKTRVFDDDRPLELRTFHGVRIDAVWFRRRSGFTVAVLGQVWGSVRGDEVSDTPTVAQALENLTDGRYGGSWEGRWDGDSYASESPQSPEEQARILAILQPMLDGYPALPPGYDGWWRYPTTKEMRAIHAARTAKKETT